MACSRVNFTSAFIEHIYIYIYIYIYKNCGAGSSLGIATDYRLDGLGSNPGGFEIFCPSRPALGPTQPRVQLIPGLSRGKVQPGRAADHSPHSSAASWKSRAIHLPTLWATPGL